MIKTWFYRAGSKTIDDNGHTLTINSRTYVHDLKNPQDILSPNKYFPNTFYSPKQIFDFIEGNKESITILNPDYESIINDFFSKNPVSVIVFG